MVLGGFKVAPAPPFAYIFGCVRRRACQSPLFFLFLKSLITGSGEVACWAATQQQQQQQHVRDKSALFRIDRKFIN